MSSINYTSKDFIRKVLIENTESLLNDFDYYSFSIISQGIETLGAFLDSYDLHQPGQSKKRFEKALKLLFPSTYTSPSTRIDLLYKHLRCGLAHVSKPQNGVILSSYKSGASDDNHFGIYETNLILVANTLFKDFKNACEKIIENIDNNNSTSLVPVNKKQCSLVIIDQLVVESKSLTFTGFTTTT